jgi:hypothetical protein
MSLGYPITVRNVFDDLLLICGIEKANNAPMYIRERALTDINATLQFIQAAGGDFFNREVSTTATVSGTASYPLTGVQQVVGPVRIGAMPLRELASRGEYDLYAAMLGASGDVAAASNAKPTAYFLQRLRDTANEATSGENTELTLLLAPTPDAIYSVAAEVTKLARNVTYADLTAGSQLVTVDLSSYTYAGHTAGMWFVIYDGAATTVGVWFSRAGAGSAPTGLTRTLQVALIATDTAATAAAKLAAAIGVDGVFEASVSGNVVSLTVPALVALTAPTNGATSTGFTLTCVRSGSAAALLPMPHKYVASLFLPIARYNVTTCPWALYRHEGHMAGIQADYTRALALLGVNDPRYLPPVPARDREKRAEARGTLTLKPPEAMATT